MADPEIEVVKAVFAAFAERDVEGVPALADPDIVFIAVTSEYAGRSEPYRGHDGMRECFRDVAEVWDELRLNPQKLRGVGGERIAATSVVGSPPSAVIFSTRRVASSSSDRASPRVFSA